MQLGAFSVSLAVKDLATSKSFYENMGFSVFAGDKDKGYYIMKNGDSLIGIFQGMFQGNIITFNPGWDQSAQNLDAFNDVREIQSVLQSKGVSLDKEVGESKEGPGSIMFKDPDGNVILIDQHR